MNVLLIDDHTLFREGLAILEATAATDLVLIELALPGMQGLEGIALLHQRYPSMPVRSASSRRPRLRPYRSQR